MQPNLVRKFKTLAVICLFTSLAGVLFQLIGEELIDYRSVIIGFPLGLVFGLILCVLAVIAILETAGRQVRD